MSQIPVLASAWFCSGNRKTVSFSVESLEYIWTLLKMAPAYWVSWNWQVIFLKNRYGFLQVEIEVAALLWWLLSALAKYVIHLYYVISMELDRGHKNYAICIPKTSKSIQTWNWWWLQRAALNLLCEWTKMFAVGITRISMEFHCTEHDHQIVLDTGGLPTDHLQGIGWITLYNSSETWFW